jgi:pheromone shutdown protein TraB
MITLIGTGHVFDLNNQIRNIILKKHPDLIALELDKGRYGALIQKDVDEKREGLYGKMAATQEKIAGMYGVSVGSEMLTSVNVAKELGIRIAFIDMPAESIQKRLQDALEYDLLSTFEKEDIRGAFAVRNFIAHDYEGINLSLIENVIRDYLPKIKKVIEKSKL